MTKIDKRALQVIANRLRQYVLAMAYYAEGAHISPAYSALDIMTFLYWNHLNITPENMAASDRDRFILSKGHCSAALYAVLAEKGFFDRIELKTFCQTGSRFGGHPDMNKIPGVEASTGSLGHGLSMALGMALSGKVQNKDYKVVALLGDGECQEGTVWEAAMAAAQLQLDNLTVVIDYNKLQGMGEVTSINSLEPFATRWESFGWSVQEIDGHDYGQIADGFELIPLQKGKPSVVIAHTVKGQGVTFMENKAIWHYRLPNKDEMKIACDELGIDDIEGVLT